MVLPEFLGADATPENVLNAIQQLTIPSVRNKMIKELKSADDMWCKSGVGAGKLIAEYIKKSA